jgi:hypothetical protein
MLKTEKQVLQEKIQSQFADLVEGNRERLCQNCRSWYGWCEFHLLPVTAEGRDCPYFQRRAE